MSMPTPISSTSSMAPFTGASQLHRALAKLNPPYDQSSATARLATWIVTHLLAEIFDQPR
jgi:hypothetical protein